MTARWKERDALRLTPVELEVMALVGDLLPYAEIAARLHISERLVRRYVRQVASKLGGPPGAAPQLVVVRYVASRSEAA